MLYLDKTSRSDWMEIVKLFVHTTHVSVVIEKIYQCKSGTNWPGQYEFFRNMEWEEIFVEWV